MPRAAAFFDLDKTLMAGSSGMQFARVATRHGIVSRRQLASWGVEHLRYRLRGTTDERTTEVLRLARELIAGVPARDLERMNPEVLAAILPRIYPQMLDEVHAHQDAGRADLHRQRRRQRRGRAAGPRAGHGRRHRHPLRGRRRGRLHRPLRRALRLRPGQGRGDGGLRRRARHRPRRVLRLLRLALRPADAAGRRPRGRRQPRPAAGRDRQARGLADDALRAPRPAAGRDRRHPAGGGRRLRRLTQRRAPQAPPRRFPRYGASAEPRI